jgi:hypothetical protein
VAKKYSISGIFILGRTEFQARRVHQERVANLAGARRGLGLSCSASLQIVSLLGTGRQAFRTTRIHSGWTEKPAYL